MIHLIVGNTGAGKTTYAHNLRGQNKGIIFSIDKWNNSLFLKDKTKNNGIEWMLERINRSENLIEYYILQLEHNGVDSILDLGLSKFEHRQKFRDFAIRNKIKFKLHYVDIATNLRKERIIERNTKKGITYEFEVKLQDFEFMESWFEAPTQEELRNSIHITE